MDSSNEDTDTAALKKTNSMLGLIGKGYNDEGVVALCQWGVRRAQLEFCICCSGLPMAEIEKGRQGSGPRLGTQPSLRGTAFSFRNKGTDGEPS